ncbi:hypothetical protein [Sphingomonas sp. MM-1]|uniref:hypothetical protein n=1 Tax=Sphingomonas sp. MM-1 TaxID=745310 RepID=UPI0005A4461D|nr:hypothetical protein [Sphingomonas sp. MM-1]
MTSSELRAHADRCRDVARSLPAGACRQVLIDAARDYDRRADRLDLLARTPVARWLDRWDHRPGSEIPNRARLA